MNFSTPAYQRGVHSYSSLTNETRINVFRREGEELFRSYRYPAAALALKQNQTLNPAFLELHSIIFFFFLLSLITADWDLVDWVLQ